MKLDGLRLWLGIRLNHLDRSDTGVWRLRWRLNLAHRVEWRWRVAPAFGVQLRGRLLALALLVVRDGKSNLAGSVLGID